jgi:undecaprenyl-diphosphatase
MLEFLNQTDALIFILINSHHSLFFDQFFFVISQLGNGWVAVPLAAIIIIMATPRNYLVRALICAVIAGSLTGIANTQVKRLTHRPRPVAYFEKQMESRPEKSGSAAAVHVVGRRLREHSFPSGHAATAFAAASILVLLYGGYFYLGFIPAFLVAYSRVYMGVHFPSDVLGGAVLGSAVVYFVILLFRQNKLLALPAILRRGHAEQ